MVLLILGPIVLFNIFEYFLNILIKTSMDIFVIYIGITIKKKSFKPKNNDYFILLWSMRVFF
jgi:hypothetical protein